MRGWRFHGIQTAMARAERASRRAERDSGATQDAAAGAILSAQSLIGDILTE